jgi:hypothetical protein
MKIFQFAVRISIVPAVVAIASFGSAVAQMSLTPQGVADGFRLTTVVSGLPNGAPIGWATNNAGDLVGETNSVTGYVFKDLDGQSFSDALSAPQGPAFGTMDITNDGGVLYGGDNSDPEDDVPPTPGRLIRLKNNGAIDTGVSTTPGFGVAGFGIATNPITHHIVAVSVSGIWDIDPSTGMATEIRAAGSLYAAAISANGNVTYTTRLGRVFGIDYSGDIIYESPYLAGLADLGGLGVLSGAGEFAGDLVTSGEDGNVYLLDPDGLFPDGQLADLIASGGSGANYIGIDLTNGSLLLTQSDSLLRLTTGVPESSTWAMLLLGFVGVGFAGFLGRRNAVALA